MLEKQSIIVQFEVENSQTSFVFGLLDYFPSYKIATLFLIRITSPQALLSYCVNVFDGPLGNLIVHIA
jgi:hypothetical protein